MTMGICSSERRNLGYLMKGDRLIGMVSFQLDEEEDFWGHSRIYGDFALKGRAPRPEEVTGAMTIHSVQGYSINLEVTQNLPENRFQFRIRRAETSAEPVG